MGIVSTDNLHYSACLFIESANTLAFDIFDGLLWSRYLWVCSLSNTSLYSNSLWHIHNKFLFFHLVTCHFILFICSCIRTLYCLSTPFPDSLASVRGSYPSLLLDCTPATVQWRLARFGPLSFSETQAVSFFPPPLFVTDNKSAYLLLLWTEETKFLLIILTLIIRSLTITVPLICVI